MPENWSRRALLGSLGTAALAGCIVDDRASGVDSTRTTSPEDGTTSDLDGETATPSRDEPATPERIRSDWPMPGADPGRSNYAAGASGPTEPVAELWTTTTDASLSAPIVADGTLYLGGDDGVVRALDARMGAERWEGSVGAPAETPWAIDGKLVVPTSEGVVALDPRDGTETWQVETPDRASVLVASHGVYWLSRRDSSVVGLARADGSERWRTVIRNPWEPYLFASDESVFVSSGTHDRIPWTLDPESGEVVGREPRSGADFPAERFYLDGTIYAVDGFFGNVVATPVADGERGWSEGVTGLGTYAISGGASRVYYVANAGEKPGLYALSRSNGAVEWHTDAAAGFVRRPVVAEEAVLVRTDDALRCFDPTDGTEQWSHPGDDIGERFVVADDLVFATRDDTVRAFRPP